MNRDQRIASALGVVGLVTLVCGLALGGNPLAARRERRDQDRSARLSQASSAIQNIYVTQRHIPTSTEAYIEALQATGMFPRELPIAALPEYRSLGPDTYELCDTFETSIQNQHGSLVRPGLYPEEFPDFWSHDAGKQCYTVRVPKP